MIMARKNQSLQSRKVWSTHFNLYKDVFCYSLDVLDVSIISKKIEEDDISAVLLGVLQETCKKWSKERRSEIPAPLAQLPQQDPDKAQIKGLNALPQPDFTCPKFDMEMGESIFLDIECKLLGEPTSPTWILNRNYVKHGVDRFDCIKHEYGKHAPSGMMIGYMVSMTPKTILGEVNEQLHADSYQELDFAFTNKVDAYRVVMQRRKVKPVDFAITHIWADLRK
jgi:hypothetical protein